MKKKFKRSPYDRKTLKDNEGNVTIRITLCDKDKRGCSIKGNLSKTITIQNAKVSEVYKALEKALFD